MRFIPTSIHGVADYLVGLAVLASPFIFGWTGAGRWTLVALGAITLAYSLCTNYELGLVRILSIRSHLMLDTVFGLAMLAVPWLFDLPKSLCIIGLLAVILVATTKLTPESV